MYKKVDIVRKDWVKLQKLSAKDVSPWLEFQKVPSVCNSEALSLCHHVQWDLTGAKQMPNLV
jgi:hypothetical protein